MSTLEKTEDFVARAHAGQVDKAGRPYLEHVHAVADRLRGHGQFAYIAGLLHDVVEDTMTTLDDLRRMGFAEIVVEAVDAVSHRAGEDYPQLIKRAAAHPLGCVVKLADNRHNSDPWRLAQLPKQTASRLRNKYAEARRLLLPAYVAYELEAMNTNPEGLVFGLPMTPAGAR